MSASFKSLTYFFVFSFLPLLFASICPSFLSCFFVAAVLGTCLHFLSTSDLQMNCMLRSSSTRPLVRSWTMPSMTWHLCRRSLAASSLPLFCLVFWDLPFSLCGTYVPSSHLTLQTIINKKIFFFPTSQLFVSLFFIIHTSYRLLLWNLVLMLLMYIVHLIISKCIWDKVRDFLWLGVNECSSPLTL